MTNKETIDQALVDLLSEVEQGVDQDTVEHLQAAVLALRSAKQDGVRMAFDAILKELGQIAIEERNDHQVERAGMVHDIVMGTTALQRAVEEEC